MILDKNIKIGKYTLSDYCYGRCHLFAIAAKEFFSSIDIKSEIWSFMEFDDPHVPNLTCLDHAFIKTDKFFFDAHGIREIEEIQNEYTLDSYESELMDDAFFQIWFKEHSQKKYIPNFYKGEKEKIINFLRSIFV